MFGNILLVFMGLFVQELVSVNALVFATHRGLYPALLIHILFLVGTALDIVIGYKIGTYLRKKSANTRVTQFVHRLANRFSVGTKKYRRWIALFVLGNLSFPYVNMCIAAYLDLPFWESAFFTLLGNIIWYVAIWIIVIGASSVTRNIPIAFGIMIAATVAVFSVVKKVRP